MNTEVLPRLFLDLAEAAEFLRIKKATLYTWVHQRKIPFRKHGGRLVFHRYELEAWSDRQVVQPLHFDAFPLQAARATLSLRGRKPRRSLTTHPTAEDSSDSPSTKGE